MKNNIESNNTNIDKYSTLDEVSYAISAEELSDENRLLLCMVCLKLPRDMVDKLGEEVIFLDFGGMNAFHVCLEDFKQKNLICFSDEFDCLTNNTKIKIILHEIGHHILGHKSTLHLNCCPDCFEKFEKEAEAFAQQYM